MHSRSEYYKYSCKRLKLAQVLGQLGVFLTTPRAAASPHAVTSSSKISATPHAGLRRPARSHDRVKAQCNTSCRTTASPHAVTSSSKISATPHAGLRRPHTQSRPGQGSDVQHPEQDCGVPTRNHSRLKDQCNTPCRTTASPHAVTAGSRLSATPHAGLWRPHTQSRPGQGSVQHPGQDCGVPTRSHSRLNAQCKHDRKKGVRLAQKMQVGPCIPVGNTSNTVVKG